MKKETCIKERGGEDDVHVWRKKHNAIRKKKEKMMYEERNMY